MKCSPSVSSSPTAALHGRGTDRSIGYAARHGFGLMLSTLPSFETLARQVGFYRAHVQEALRP